MSATSTMEAVQGNTVEQDTYGNMVNAAVAHVVEYTPCYEPVTQAEVEAGRYYGFDPDGDGVNAFSGV